MSITSSAQFVSIDLPIPVPQVASYFPCSSDKRTRSHAGKGAHYSTTTLFIFHPRSKSPPLMSQKLAIPTFGTYRNEQEPASAPRSRGSSHPSYSSTLQPARTIHLQRYQVSRKRRLGRRRRCTGCLHSSLPSRSRLLLLRIGRWQEARCGIYTVSNRHLCNSSVCA
jgi:hypothetical protein